MVDWEEYDIIPEMVSADGRPDRILNVSQEIIESESEWNRLCPRPGFGKSEGGLLTVQEFDKFLAFQYETMWDKYEAYQEQKKDCVNLGPEPVPIVAWNKAIGIKSHEGTVDSIEELDRDKIPKKFRIHFTDPYFDKLRKKTVEDGGKAARDEFWDTQLYQVWADQFRDPDYGGVDYSDKAIFTTVSMASKFKRIWNGGKTFTDEGLAGRVDGNTYEDYQDNPVLKITNDFTDWKKISGNNYNLSIRQLKQNVEITQRQKQAVEKAMEMCRDMTSDLMTDIENNSKEMTMEKTRKEDGEIIVESKHTVGVLDWNHKKALKAQQKIKPLKLPKNYDEDNEHSTYWQAERRENRKDRTKLIALEEAIEWFMRGTQQKIVYLKKGNDLCKVVAPKHYKNIVQKMGSQHFLLKATYTPLWDEQMDLDVNYVMEDKSIRNTDLSRYEGEFHYYKYRHDKQSINNDGLETNKMEYLYQLLDQIESEALKIVPKKIVGQFDSKVETKESAIGKNFRDTDDLYSIGLQRLDDWQYAWEFAKEFQRLPDSDPSDVDNKLIQDHTFKAFTSDDLQVILADRVEAPTVDSLFRNLRNIDDEGSSNYLGAKTRGLEQNWFGNLDIKSTKTVEGLISQIAKSKPKKAIKINERLKEGDEQGYSLKNKEWTNRKDDGLSVDHRWAVEYLAHKHDTFSKKLAMEFSDKSRTAIGNAIEDSENIVKVEWGVYQLKM